MFFHTRSIRAVVFAIFIAFCNLATVTGARIVHNSLSELFSASAGEIHLGPSNQIRAAATLGTALELTYDVNKCTVGTPRSVLFDASTNDFEERNENPNSFIEHVPTVSRGIRVTDCSFGSEGSAGGGGLEMRGPTLEAAMYWRLRESASAPASIGVTLNDVWGAAPLHIVISSNTFASGACSVLRYAGALPPHSTVQITRNTFRLIKFAPMGFAANNQVPLGSDVGLSMILIRGHEFDGQSNLFFNCTVNITDSTLMVDSQLDSEIDTPLVFLVGIPILQSTFGSSSATFNSSKLLIHRNRVDTFIIRSSSLRTVGSVILSLGGGSSSVHEVFIFESAVNLSENSLHHHDTPQAGSLLRQSAAVVVNFSPNLSGASSVVVCHNTFAARFFEPTFSTVVWVLAGDQLFDPKTNIMNSSQFLIEFNEARLASTACATAETICAVWTNVRNCPLMVTDSSVVSISSNRLLVDGCLGNNIEKFNGAEIRLLRISVSSGAIFTASNNSATLSRVVGAATSIYGLAVYVGGSAEVAGTGSTLTLSDNVVRIADIDNEVGFVSGCYFYMHSGGHINVTRLARTIASNNTATVISTNLDSLRDLLSYISGFSAELEAGLSIGISDGSWALITGNVARAFVYSALSYAYRIEGARLEASAFVLRGGSLTASDNSVYFGDSVATSSATTGVACVRPLEAVGFVISIADLGGVDSFSATAHSQLMLSRNTVVFDCPSCGASDVAGAMIQRSSMSAASVAPCAVLAADSELAFVGNAIHIRPSGLSSDLAHSTSNIMAVFLNLESCDLRLQASGEISSVGLLRVENNSLFIDASNSAEFPHFEYHEIRCVLLDARSVNIKNSGGLIAVRSNTLTLVADATSTVAAEIKTEFTLSGVSVFLFLYHEPVVISGSFIVESNSLICNVQTSQLSPHNEIHSVHFEPSGSGANMSLFGQARLLVTSSSINVSVQTLAAMSNMRLCSSIAAVHIRLEYALSVNSNPDVGPLLLLSHNTVFVGSAQPSSWLRLCVRAVIFTHGAPLSIKIDPKSRVRFLGNQIFLANAIVTTDAADCTRNFDGVPSIVEFVPLGAEASVSIRGASLVVANNTMRVCEGPSDCIPSSSPVPPPMGLFVGASDYYDYCFTLSHGGQPRVSAAGSIVAIAEDKDVALCAADPSQWKATYVNEDSFWSREPCNASQMLADYAANGSNWDAPRLCGESEKEVAPPTPTITRAITVTTTISASLSIVPSSSPSLFLSRSLTLSAQSTATPSSSPTASSARAPSVSGQSASITRTLSLGKSSTALPQRRSSSFSLSSSMTAQSPHSVTKHTGGAISPTKITRIKSANTHTCTRSVSSWTKSSAVLDEVSTSATQSPPNPARAITTSLARSLSLSAHHSDPSPPPLPTTEANTTVVTPIAAPAPPSLAAAPGEAAARQSVGSLAAVAGAVASPAAMLQLDAVASVMEMASCEEGYLGNPSNNSKSGLAAYDATNNPLHLFIGPDDGAAERGALLGCLIIFTAASAAVVARSIFAARRATKAAPFGSFVLPVLSIPLLGFPSVLLLPAAFVIRMAVRAGVRLAVLSSGGGDSNNSSSNATGDVALGIISVALCGAYIAHVAFVMSSLSLPAGVLCYSAAYPSAALPKWHRRLEAFAGPSCVWMETSEAKSAAFHGESAGGSRQNNPPQPLGDGSEAMVPLLHSTPSALSPQSRQPCAGSPPRSSDEGQIGDTARSSLDYRRSSDDNNVAVAPMEKTAMEADSESAVAVAWLERNRRYVAKARHFAWYSPLQLLTASVLKGLAASQLESSCLARNAITFSVIAMTLTLLLALRPRPVPSTAGWANAVANNALLLIFASLNTANAAIAGGDQRLTNAVVWVSYAAMGAAAVGTALSMARLVVNTFPQFFGTQTPIVTPLLGGESSVGSSSDDVRRGRVARRGGAEADGSGGEIFSPLASVFFGTDAAVDVGILSDSDIISFPALPSADPLPRPSPLVSDDDEFGAEEVETAASWRSPIIVPTQSEERVGSWRGGSLHSGGGGHFASLSPRERIAVGRLMADFQRYESVREVPRDDHNGQELPPTGEATQISLVQHASHIS